MTSIPQICLSVPFYKGQLKTPSLVQDIMAEEMQTVGCERWVDLRPLSLEGEAQREGSLCLPDSAFSDLNHKE